MSQTERRPQVPKHLARWAEKHPPYLPHESREAVTEGGAGSPIEQYKLSLRRYDPSHTPLPYEMLCECPTCDAVVPSTFFMADGQLVLAIRCRKCGRSLEAHHDVLWRSDVVSDRRHSAKFTYGGTKIKPALHELPRTVETLCPTCGCNIIGRYYVKNGRVMIEKTCPEHGYFRDCVNSDVKVYLRASYWTFEELPGLANPHVTHAAHCPSDCGLCNQHQSTAVLAQIDLTNRCNLTCPVCFASANGSGYVHEPTYEQVEKELMRLLDCRPIPCTSIQFTGGEPTIHSRFHDIVRRAGQLGMTNIQIATNGITHANLEFAQRSKEAGLHTLYLQFDGLDDRLYQRVRGRPLLEVKLQAIENCRRVGMKICLVPTVIKSENDDQVPRILDFAAENADVISGISYQPVAFTGRISRRELAKKRYTLGDLAHAIAAHSGAELERDFFPLSFMSPLSNLLSAVEHKPKITCSCHSDCAFGTYFFVAPRSRPGQPMRERLVPIPRVFDVPALFIEMNELARRIAPKSGVSFLDKARIFWMVWKNFHRQEAPPGMTAMKFIQAIAGCVSKQGGRTETAQKENYRTLMCAGMHFQDRYNFDVERIKRCVIHYSTPDGLYPFCTYNCGPTFRSYIEAMWSTPNKTWIEAHPGMRIVPPSSPNAVMPWIGRLGAEPDEDESWRTLRRGGRSNLVSLLPEEVVVGESGGKGGNGKGKG
jgi:7,8-dihydro-6-hydroxymethylpterin dimethyltransferase